MNILWDFDGTIFDTFPSLIKNFKTALSYEVEDDVIRDLLKRSSKEAFQYFNLPEKETNEILHLRELSIHPVEKPPFEGVLEVLRYAKKNVIMTHKSRKSVMEILNFFDMAHYFSEIICREDGFKQKPHPESYFFLHNKHRVDLVIGDRMLDLIPGKEIGAKTCSFQNRSIDADYHIDSYKDFFNIVAKNFERTA